MPTPRKLPFWRTVWQAYRGTFGSLGYLFRISWLWLLVMVPIVALMTPSLLKQWVISEEMSEEFSRPLITLILLPSLSSIGVAWLRWLLIGERVTARAYLRFDGFVLRFIPFSFLVWLIQESFVIVSIFPWSWLEAALLLEMYGVGLSMILPPVAISILAISGSARLAAVLPAKALGMNGITLADAWRATRGNTWRLMLGTMLCSAPAYVLTMLLFVAVMLMADRDTMDALTKATVVVVLVTYGSWLLSLSFTGFYGSYLLQLTATEDAPARATMQGADHAPVPG